MTDKTGPPVFKIDQILDKSTFVISGDDFSRLNVGSRLSILAFGSKLSAKDVPIVLVKATLEITQWSEAYVVAQTPEETREHYPYVPAIAAITGSAGPKTVRYRPGLDVPDDEQKGNPAKGPIKTGDLVIKEDDYSDYVASLVKTSKS